MTSKHLTISTSYLGVQERPKIATKTRVGGQRGVVFTMERGSDTKEEIILILPTNVNLTKAYIRAHIRLIRRENP